jgi:hypothetical protein
MTGNDSRPARRAADADASDFVEQTATRTTQPASLFHLAPFSSPDAMPPRKAPAAVSKAAKVEPTGPLLGPDEVLAALVVREPFGELRPSLQKAVEALVEPPLPPPPPPTGPSSSELKTPAAKTIRSTRTPATAPPVAAAGSSRARTRTAEAALPTPPPTPAPAPRPETIRFCMQLVNALLSLLAAPATAAAPKEAIATFVSLAGLALGVLRKGLTKDTERVGIEKACAGLASRLGTVGAVSSPSLVCLLD